MLTTVVSLTSDDPGLGAARDTETSRGGGGEGVTMLRPESDAEQRSDGRGGASPGQCQCQDQARRYSGLGREMFVTTWRNSRAFKITCEQEIVVNC